MPHLSPLAPFAPPPLVPPSPGPRVSVSPLPRFSSSAPRLLCSSAQEAARCLLPSARCQLSRLSARDSSLGSRLCSPSPPPRVSVCPALPSRRSALRPRHSAHGSRLATLPSALDARCSAPAPRLLCSSAPRLRLLVPPSPSPRFPWSLCPRVSPSPCLPPSLPARQPDPRREVRLLDFSHLSRNVPSAGRGHRSPPARPHGRRRKPETAQADRAFTFFG
jgi:hypothetical protein